MAESSSGDVDSLDCHYHSVMSQLDFRPGVGIDDERVLRRRATALFFALEQGLTRLLTQGLRAVEDVPQELRVALQGRARDKGGDPSSVSSLVENMYFGEMLDVLAGLPDGSEEVRRAAAQVREFVNSGGLHEVRVAVAHQNRRWRPMYLPLLEALCLNEAVTVGLALEEVAEAYACVKANSFQVPDGPWLTRIRPSSLPNNLDEHVRANGLVTFVGRTDERRRLRRSLMAPRTNSVSIVGPGGIGKTAFALKTLQDLAQDSSAAARFDRLVFVTGKRHRLTVMGRIGQTPDFESLEELRLAVALELGSDSFEECTQAFDDLRLLLCVDNVEDLLNLNPQAIEEFQEQLPVPWVLLLTSRIAVSSQVVIPLQPLSASDLEKIAAERLAARGMAVDGETTRQLSSAAESPLALILAVDAVATGGASVAHALSQAKGLSADFAFSSLIELQNKDALRCLDAIHVTGERVSADALATLLNTSVSRIEDLIVGLRQAGLLASSLGQGVRDGDSPLALSPSVKELLARRSVSDVKRNALYESWTRLQSEAQLLADIDDDGLPERELRPPARIQLLRVWERLKRADSVPPEDLKQIGDDLAAFESVFGPTPNSKWVMAELASRKEDSRHLIERHLCEALNLAPQSWRIRWRLGKLAHEQRQFVSCAEYLKPVVTSIGDNRSGLDARTKSEIVHRYFTARLFFEGDRLSRGGEFQRSRFDEVSKELDQIVVPELDLICRLVRASVFRRSVERGATVAEQIAALSRGLDILGRTFEEGGRIVPWWCPECIAFLQQFERTMRWIPEPTVEYAEQMRALWCFCDRWGAELALKCRVPTELAKVMSSITARLQTFGLTSAAQSGASAPSTGGGTSLALTQEMEELFKLGFRECVIYAPPVGRSYCFAKDCISGVQYYVNLNEADCPVSRFRDLRMGERILVLPATQDITQGRAVPCLSAVVFG